MVELVRTALRDALGAADPAARGPGATVRILEPAGQFYVTGGSALAANACTDGDPYRLWLAPDRALVVGAAPVEGFVSDVTDGLVLFEIAGPARGEIVAMGTTLDPALLARGRCAQTIFAGVKAVLYEHGDAIRLHAERQFAAFLLEWFRQAVSALEDSSS